MYQFVYKRDEKNHFDDADITFTIPEAHVPYPVLIEQFERFLCACGFNLGGTLDVVENEEPIDAD